MGGSDSSWSQRAGRPTCTASTSHLPRPTCKGAIGRRAYHLAHGTCRPGTMRAVSAPNRSPFNSCPERQHVRTKRCSTVPARHAPPDKALCPEARAARKTYLSWARDHIPHPTEVVVSAWNAMYDEAEHFRRLADPKNATLRGEPKIAMAVYPSRFKDKAAFEPGGMPHLSQQGEEWRNRLFTAARAILGK